MENLIGADIAWMLMSVALVLLMTPGVAFFYGGMVPARSVVSTKFQSFACIGVVGLIWAICGYSLVFSGADDGSSKFIGNLDFAFLNGVGMEPNEGYGKTIPHVLFMLFQATFAIITPALITGAVAERVRFKAWIVLMALWSLLVYVPVAHWVWGPGGWIAKMGGLDFAGGLVVHMTSGYAALVAAMMLGNRTGFKPEENNSFSVLLVMLGGTFLWIGWFGFNAGSALGASGLAGHAAATTFFAAATAMTIWILMDWFVLGKPSAVGAMVGAVAGLVAITPAAGFVTVQAALVIGLVAAVLCNLACKLIKNKLKTDDTVDVFACHGVGGTIGTILTAVFATKTINPAGADGLLYGGTDLMQANLIGAVAVIAYTMVATAVIFFVVGKLMRIRVTQEDEASGLDITQHGERAFKMD